MFFTVKKSLQKQKVALFFIIDVNHTLKSQGFKTTYGRCSTARGLDGVLKDGASILSKLNFSAGGKELCFTYVKIPLKTIEERVQEMTEKAKIKAKL